jgi:hypothetical protein
MNNDGFKFKKLRVRELGPSGLVDFGDQRTQYSSEVKHCRTLLPKMFKRVLDAMDLRQAKWVGTSAATFRNVLQYPKMEARKSRRSQIAAR